MATVASKPPRRTQVQRSEETRWRIMEATIELLVEQGHAATTTLAVQERAGVSRGGMQHHFPSRNELLVAAVGHLARERLAEIAEQVQNYASEDFTIPDAIRRLWETFKSPHFVAAMELWAMARTNPELRTVLRPAEVEHGHASRRFLAALFGPNLSRHPNFRDVSDHLVGGMRSAIMTKVVRAPGSDRRLVQQWITLAEALLAPDAPHLS